MLARARAEGCAKALRHPTEEEEATEMSEARSVAAPWEENAHALVTSHGDDASRLEAIGKVWPATIRRSVRECRETLGTPEIRMEPKTPFFERRTSKEGGVHAMKVA
jgi:hypothetical protein